MPRGTDQGWQASATTPGFVNPIRARHLIEVDIGVLRARPQTVPGVVPGRPRWCRGERGHLGRTGGQPDQPRERLSEDSGRTVRGRQHGAASDIELRGGDVATEGYGAGEWLQARITGLKQATLNLDADTAGVCASSPRASGAGPYPLRSWVNGYPFSPRKRGWSGEVVDEGGTFTVLLGQAGLVPGSRRSSPPSRRSPRASGAGPNCPCCSPGVGQFSPRKRG